MSKIEALKILNRERVGLLVETIKGLKAEIRTAHREALGEEVDEREVINLIRPVLHATIPEMIACRFAEVWEPVVIQMIASENTEEPDD